MGPDAMILVFQILSLKPAFSLSFLILIKRVLSFRSLLFFLDTRPLEIYLQIMLNLVKSICDWIVKIRNIFWNVE